MERAVDPSTARWRPAPPPALSGAQKDWLTRGGSLTRHLQQLGRVDVRITREAVDTGWFDEAFSLALPARAPVWVREVALLVDGTPYVAAHSIVPLAASRGPWQAIRRLRTRPLAELLYRDRTVSRSALVSCRVGQRHPLAALAHRALHSGGPLACHESGGTSPEAVDDPPDGVRSQAKHALLLARRSLFVRRGVPLLVTECMLPALWAHVG